MRYYCQISRCKTFLFFLNEIEGDFLATIILSAVAWTHAKVQKTTNFSRLLRLFGEEDEILFA
jgi:hypothetical protein